MGTVFIKVLNLSIITGWLVLAVVVLRILFRKAPKWIFCILWGMVGIRLCLPVSIESAFSLIPSAETVPQEIMYSETPEIHTGFAMANSVVNPLIQDTISSVSESGESVLHKGIDICGIIWLVGAGIMLIFAAIGCLKLRKRTAAAIRYKEDLGPVRVYECDEIDSPFLLGVFKPGIYIPSGMDSAIFESVYAHEAAHIKRRDYLWKPLGFLVLAIYWFNPLVWLAYILLCRDIEAACDEKVIGNMDSTGRALYSQALLKCGTRVRKLSICPLAFGETGVKSRVKSILNYRKPAFWIVIVALIVCMIVGVCFLTDPKTEKIAEGDITVMDSGYIAPINIISQEMVSFDKTNQPICLGVLSKDVVGYIRMPVDMYKEDKSVQGKEYICTDEGVNTHTKLENKSLRIQLYGSGYASYSQPIYSSFMPTANWTIEDNIVKITDQFGFNYLEIVEGGLRFRAEGSHGFMFYNIPDGTFFALSYYFQEEKATE